MDRNYLESIRIEESGKHQEAMFLLENLQMNLGTEHPGDRILGGMVSDKLRELRNRKGT